jgi:hypothetical protein
MKKSEEIKNPESCFNKAKGNETLFVLLGRDPVAWKVVKEWCANRIIWGLNKPDDPQIIEALALAKDMQKEANAKLVFLHPYWVTIIPGGKREIPGWYFWGEDEVNYYGPYQTKSLAEAALISYGKTF